MHSRWCVCDSFTGLHQHPFRLRPRLLRAIVDSIVIITRGGGTLGGPPSPISTQSAQSVKRRRVNLDGLLQRIVGVGSTTEELEQGPQRRPFDHASSVAQGPERLQRHSSEESRGPHNAGRESCCSGRSFVRNHMRLQVCVHKRVHVSARKDTPPLCGGRVPIALWPVTHGLGGARTRLTQLLQSGTILVPQEISANYCLLR